MIHFHKINKLLLFFLFFVITSCSSVPKYPQNACKIFGENYLWYKSAKKSSDTYGAPIHIILAIIIVPFVLRTLFLAFTNQFEKHRFWAKITFPIWYYVSITGVLVYFFLYQWFPSNVQI